MRLIKVMRLSIADKIMRRKPDAAASGFLRIILVQGLYLPTDIV
ncbi:hypothetical protein [Pontibacter sp. 172403-2]|nr:hypothetical protein [Pontibacter sp. 172403-2]